MIPLHQRCRNNGHLIHFVGVAAAAEVVNRRVQSLQDRAEGGEPAEPLGDLVSDVAALLRSNIFQLIDNYLHIFF